MNKKPFVILGGMGPQASVYMYKTIIDLAVNEFNAKENDDFPDVIIESVPVPDFISDEINKERALIMLKEKVIQLSKMDISNFSIACNTAHLLINELKNMTNVPFMSMIDEIIAAVLRSKIKKVGILGSPTTIRTALYRHALNSNGIQVIEPQEEQSTILNNVIRNVIGETATVIDKTKLLDIADSLYKEGAEGIILGCTELPLVFPRTYKVPVFNSVEVLARSLLKKYYNTN